MIDKSVTPIYSGTHIDINKIKMTRRFAVRLVDVVNIALRPQMQACVLCAAYGYGHTATHTKVPLASPVVGSGKQLCSYQAHDCAWPMEDLRDPG